jgi:hypothetical protein
MEEKNRNDDFIGLCPECHGRPLNVHADRKNHWSVCETHKLKWHTGYGLFSFPFTDDHGEWSWENGERVLERNRVLLASCQTVEPFFWPR